MRVWFYSGVEADICIQSICDVEVTNHSVGTCDNGDNTYDLTVEISAVGLEIGDSLILYVENGGYADNGLKITNISENFTFNATGLQSTGNLITFSISEWNGGCSESFNAFYTAPSPCVSPPSNDDCIDAIEITGLSICNTFHPTVLGATSDNNTNGCSQSAADVWYKFTATSNRMSLTGIELTDYDNAILEYEIYTNGCGGAIHNSCNSLGYWCEGCNSVIYDLTIGQEYYLRIWFIQGLEADVCLEELCNITITNTTVGMCDNGDNSYDLTVDISATDLIIGDSILLFVEGLNNKYADNGLKVTNSSANFTFNVSDLQSNGLPISIQIFNPTRSCFEYFFQEYTSPAICVPAPANDDCLNAIEITDISTCNTIHASIIGATSENNTNGCFTEFGDVWYKFTATSSTVEIIGVDLSDYNNSSFRFELFTGDCNSVTKIGDNGFCPVISCEGCGSSVSNLTIGEEYLLRIIFDDGFDADFCVKADCELEVLYLQNSVCSSSDNTYNLGVEIGMTNMEIGDSLVLNINGGPHPTIFKYELTEVSDTTIFIFPNLPADNEMHYLFIQTQGENSCEAETTFMAPFPCVPTPTNDSCHQAQIVDLSNCDVMHVDLTGATSEDNVNWCESPIDVWYTFTATTSSVYFLVSDFVPTGSNAGFSYQLYEGICSQATQFGDGNCRGFNTSPRGTNFNNLTIGEDYFLCVTMQNALEADICLEAVCDINITSHSVGTCDNGDNTYDLTVEIATIGLEVGDSLVLFLETIGEYADNGLKITNSTENFTFTATGLPATGNPITFSISEWNGGCYQFFYDFYTAPATCVSAPVNDDCANAIEITDLSSCNSIHVITTGATSENITNGCTQSAADVWYKFTATSSQLIVDAIEMSDYGTSVIIFEFYADGCSGQNRIPNDCFSIGCENFGCNPEIEGLIIGEEYYMRVWLIGGTEVDICLKSPCDVNITSHSVSTCDNGDNTYDLTVEITANGLEIGDSLVLFLGSIGEYADNGLKITNSSANFTFNVFDLPSTGNTTSFYIEEINGGCFNYFENYYIAPTSCVPAPPNDNCLNATLITDFENCTPVHVNTQGATSEPVSFNCGAVADVWYTFVAPSTRISLETIDISSYETSFFNFDVYEAGCTATSPTVLDCHGTCEGCNVEIEGLTIGETYNLRIWLGGGTEADFCLKELCDFEILNISTTNCEPEDNNTYTLTIEFSLNNEMVGDELAISILNSYGTQTITTLEDSYIFTVQGLPSINGPVSFILSNTSQGCSESFYHYYDAPVPCVDSPVNDVCEQAEIITDLSNCNLIHFDNYGATAENDDSDCSSDGVGLWYQFTANTQSIEIKVIDLESYGSNNLLRFEIQKGICNNFNLLDCRTLCETNCNFSLSNLTIGDVYYIRLYSSFIVKGDICIQATYNNICNNTPLNFTADTINQATYQTTQTITADGIVTATHTTTFIAEQSIHLMPDFHVENGANFHAYIEDCTPPSAVAEVPSTERTSPKAIIVEPITAVNDLTIAPNPFYQSTTIKYRLEKETEVGLSIFNINGQLVAEMVQPQSQGAGYYEYTFEPKMNAGNIFFAVLITPEKVISKKMIFIQ